MVNSLTLYDKGALSYNEMMIPGTGMVDTFFIVYPAMQLKKNKITAAAAAVTAE